MERITSVLVSAPAASGCVRGIAQPKYSPHISCSPTRRKMALIWIDVERLVGLVAQLQRDAGHQLVLAALDDAVVVPAGDDVDRLERRDGLDRGAAADRHEQGRTGNGAQCGGAKAELPYAIF